MTDSIFASPSPATPDDADAGSHAWGMKFTVSDDASCVGGRAWIPAAGRPTTFLWQLWRVGDATKIAESDLNAAGHGTPASGTWHAFDSTLFATPGDVALSSAQTYRVCVAFQGGAGVYTDDGSETFPTGTGVVSASTGSFTNDGGTNVMPGTDYLAWFFADVTVESGVAPSEITLTPASVASTAQALTPTPGAVTVVLTPAAATISAQVLAATPGVVTTTLTPGPVTVIAQPLSAGEPTTPTTWRAGPPEAKWHAGQPESKWAIGGRMPVEVFRATSTEAIRSGSVTATASGAAVDPTGFTVSMAFVATDTAPAAGSSAWKAATWDTDTTTTPATYRAQAAIGPAGVQELSAGTWWLFVKVSAGSETPIIPSGSFKVVP